MARLAELFRPRAVRPPPNAKRVLFVVQERMHYREHAKLALALHATGRYEAEIAVLSTYDKVEDDRAASEAAGVPFHFRAHVAWRHRFVAAVIRRREVLDRRLTTAGYLSPISGSQAERRHFLDLFLLDFLIRLWSRPGFRALKRGCGWIFLPLLLVAERFGRTPSFGPVDAYDAFAPVLRWGVRPLVRTTFNSLFYVYDKIYAALEYAYVEPIRVFHFYYRRVKSFRRLLQARQISLVVLAEDNVGHGTGAFTRAAEQIGVPVVTIPYTIANAREFAESYFDVAEHQIRHWPNRLIARRYPQYVYEHRGRRLLRLPGWHALAQELLRLAPPRPWAYNSGRSAAVVVESEHTVEYYRKSGLTSEPLLALGALFDDDIAAVAAEADSRRRLLNVRYGLDPTKPLLVCALPPNQLPSRPRCAFRTFDDLVRAWIRPLAELKNYNVVVSLHPRLNREAMQFIEDEFGVPIIAGPTSELVPLCDLYVASVSATIRWALACGKPVINYDVFEYRYDDYDDARGLITLSTHRDYRTFLLRVDDNSAHREQLQEFAEADRRRWGDFDGGAVARIIELFDVLCQKSGTSSHAHGRHRAGPHGLSSSPSCALEAA